MPYNYYNRNHQSRYGRSNNYHHYNHNRNQNRDYQTRPVLIYNINDQIKQEVEASTYRHQVPAEIHYDPNGADPFVEPDWNLVFECFTRFGPSSKGYLPINYRYEFRNVGNEPNNSPGNSYSMDGRIQDRVALPYRYFYFLDVEQRIREMLKIRRIAGLFEYIDHLRRYRRNNIAQICRTISSKYHQIRLNPSVAQTKIDSASLFAEKVTESIERCVNSIESREPLPKFFPLKPYSALTLGSSRYNGQLALVDVNNNNDNNDDNANPEQISPSSSTEWFGCIPPFAKIQLPQISIDEISSFINGYPNDQQQPSSSSTLSTTVSSDQSVVCSSDSSSSSSNLSPSPSAYFTPLMSKLNRRLTTLIECQKEEDEAERAMSDFPQDCTFESTSVKGDDLPNTTVSTLNNCENVSPVSHISATTTGTNVKCLPNGSLVVHTRRPSPLILELSKAFEPNCRTTIVTDRESKKLRSECTIQSKNFTKFDNRRQVVEITKTSIKTEPLDRSIPETQDSYETHCSVTEIEERYEYMLPESVSIEDIDIPAIIQQIQVQPMSLIIGDDSTIITKKNHDEQCENMKQTMSVVVDDQHRLESYGFDRNVTRKDIKSQCEIVEKRFGGPTHIETRYNRQYEENSWDESFHHDRNGVRYTYKLNDSFKNETRKVMDEITVDSRNYIIRNERHDTINRKRGRTFKSKKASNSQACQYFQPTLALAY